MTNGEILSRVDHTLLKATATYAEIGTLCAEAIFHKTASVCVPPSHVRRIHEVHTGLVICTVIGFPLGYNVSEVKLIEAETALADGADELDMVINIGDLKNGDFAKVRYEISMLRRIAEKNIIKIIVETCYLTTEEKIRLCRIVTDAGADYIKTSTGFGAAGASLEDVLLFREHIGPAVKIKAAGGIKTRDDLESFITAGCERIGTSSAVAILTKGE